MSNSIDFYQPVQARLALPAATVSVLLDGSLCCYLELIEIVRSGWPDFSWARLAFNSAAYVQSESMSLEELGAELAIGKSVCIRGVYNCAVPGASVCGFPIFAGQIDAVETKLDNDGEGIEVVARDFSTGLKHFTVYGQHVGSLDGSTLFLAGVDTTFNDRGKANATIEPVEHNGNSLTLFAAEPTQAKLWSYAEVIDYLLCEYLPVGQLHRPGIEQLWALTEGQVVRELDVTGLNLIEALHHCCERVGLRFKFVPRFSPADPGEAVVFYRAGRGRAVELNCQSSGERFSLSKTNISTLHSRKSFFPVTHRYIGWGDFKVYEATFELVKAWDPGLEDSDYDKFSPSSNPDFYEVKNIYRKWCLNEAGDYSGQPYNQGEVFDFSEIFGSSDFAHRRRRFWPVLTTDKQGKSLGYFLQVSFDSGEHWWQYLYAFDNLLDECGVWLASDQLDADIWVAAQEGTLKFRITASVVSDERLSCAVANGPVDSVVPVVEHIISLSREFKYRKVSSRSIFANSSDESLGRPDEVDDSSALFEFVRQGANVSSEIIERVDVQTPYLAFDYQIGDRVATSPESRDLLGVRGDNRSTSWIEWVQMDFRKQCTNLRIVRQRR